MSFGAPFAFRGAIITWLACACVVPFACSSPTSGDPDAPRDATADACNGAFGCDNEAGIVFYDPCGDASLALRARALFDQTCSGGPERGCHSELAGNTTLTLNDASALYDAYGIIDIASSELPDVLRVAPYDPEQSYVDWKVCGDQRRAPGTGIMPLVDSTNWDSGSVVSCYCDLIHDWIEAGAP